jgi:hypothetical protein
MGEAWGAGGDGLMDECGEVFHAAGQSQCGPARIRHFVTVIDWDDAGGSELSFS